MKHTKRFLPNALSLLRLLGSLMLLCAERGFLPLYGLLGLTDVLDGYLARRWHTESRSGAALDSVADLLFLAVCLYRLLPGPVLPRWLWVLAAAAALLQGSAFVLLRGCPERRHSRLNRLTGLCLFAAGFFAGSRVFPVWAAVCSLLAILAGGQLLRQYKKTANTR